MKFKKIVCLIMIVSISVGLFSACKDVGGNNQSGSNKAVNNIISKDKITLTWWMPTIPEGLKSWNDSPVFKQIEKATNVKINFQGPSDPTQAGEQFSLIIASGQLPDIMTQLNFGYKGGVDQAIDDGLYIKLNDLIDKYMPNFKNYIAKEPMLKKVIVSYKGNIGWFPKVSPIDFTTRQPPYVGPIVRKDWLDKVGLDEPVTIDDWYNMLKAFKTQLNVKRPLLFPANGFVLSKAFLSAYGADIEQIVVDGKVVYGPMLPGMLQYVTEMNKWVKEGLLVCANSGDEPYYNDTTGAWVSGFYLFDTWKSKAKDPNYRVVGAKFPVLKEGDKIKSTMPWTIPTSDSNAYMITSSNKYPVETAKYFDFLYSDEGARICNYGTEGSTYKIVDGKPKFTDSMLNNKEGKTWFQMLRQNTASIVVSDWRIELQGFSEDSKDAIATKWAEAGDEWNFPNGISYTASENDTLSMYLSQITPYAQNMIGKFISGEEPLSNWQSFQDQLKNMQVDKVISTWQSAYDRFMKK